MSYSHTVTNTCLLSVSVPCLTATLYPICLLSVSVPCLTATLYPIHVRCKYLYPVLQPHCTQYMSAVSICTLSYSHTVPNTCLLSVSVPCLTATLYPIRMLSISVPCLTATLNPIHNCCQYLYPVLQPHCTQNMSAVTICQTLQSCLTDTLYPMQSLNTQICWEKQCHRTIDVSISQTEMVHWPLVPRAVVGGELDPVGHWVLLALLQSRLHPQGCFPFRYLPLSHVLWGTCHRDELRSNVFSSRFSLSISVHNHILEVWKTYTHFA